MESTIYTYTYSKPCSLYRVAGSRSWAMVCIPPRPSQERCSAYLETTTGRHLYHRRVKQVFPGTPLHGPPAVPRVLQGAAECQMTTASTPPRSGRQRRLSPECLVPPSAPISHFLRFSSTAHIPPQYRDEMTLLPQASGAGNSTRPRLTPVTHRHTRSSGDMQARDGLSQFLEVVTTPFDTMRDL